MNTTLYISGQMRGIKDYNFPAFVEAEATLKLKGYDVFNPARGDIDAGFDTSTPSQELSSTDMAEYMIRDLNMICLADAVCVLPGFEDSKGALAEIAIARFLGKQVYRYPAMTVLTHPTLPSSDSNDVLSEAYKLTSGDRQNQYGAPDQDFTRTAKMWSALKGVEFTTEDVAAFLICVKLSRNSWKGKRDNWVDIAGYARCGDICRQEKEKRNNE